jgi:hypothetical protein
VTGRPSGIRRHVWYKDGVTPAGPSALPRDLYVVSDLHLGRGRRAETRRWARLECFLYDEDFLAFCRWIRGDAEGPAPAALVLNGDVFDFLRIEPDPEPGARGAEKRFGPPPTPEVAARMVEDIVAGHPLFVTALAEVLAAGHEVIFLPGNHDLEVQSAPVQHVIRRAVEAALDALHAPLGAAGRLSFEPWFLHEPGRIWIEHGCQYDPENAFRYPLRVRVPPALARAVAEGDQPLGNFFQRYLYNAFGSITFIVPSGRANYRYFRWLLANEPRLLVRVLFDHGRFVWQLLRRLARLPVEGWREVADAAHQAELEVLAVGSGLGSRLRDVDALKAAGADAVRAASGIARQAAKLGLGALAAALLALGVFAASSAAIDTIQGGVGLRALLLLLLYLFFAALTGVGLVAAALRIPGEETPKPLRRAAARIARQVGVPLVTFGHSHDEQVMSFEAGDRREKKRGWYFNTGTWIAVFTHDVLLPRERVQYTFLRVRGLDAELLHFSPGRGRALAVVLLEEDDDRGPRAEPEGAPANGAAPVRRNDAA